MVVTCEGGFVDTVGIAFKLKRRATFIWGTKVLKFKNTISVHFLEILLYRFFWIFTFVEFLAKKIFQLIVGALVRESMHQIVSAVQHAVIGDCMFCLLKILIEVKVWTSVLNCLLQY